MIIDGEVISILPTDYHGETLWLILSFFYFQTLGRILMVNIDFVVILVIRSGFCFCDIKS